MTDVPSFEMSGSMIRVHGYSWRLHILIVLLIVSTYPAGVVGSEDGITLSKASLDFGPVALGATATQTVTITNESDVALRISKINWTCGCIQGSMKDPQITAHSESELVVRTRPTKPGKQAGTLFLYDSRGQSYQLQVSVEGIPAITVKPEVLQFGAVVQGSEPEKPLIIQFSEPRTYFVERLHFDTNLFDIEQLANSDERPNGTLRFNVRVKKSAAIGEFRETLAVYLRTEQEATACVVSLTGRVTPELYATPASLRVQLKSNNTPIQRSIILRSVTGEDFKVISLLTDAAAISAKLRLQRAGLAIIDVSVATDDAANLPQAATLSIETNVSSHPKVIVPIESHQ